MGFYIVLIVLCSSPIEASCQPKALQVLDQFCTNLAQNIPQKIECPSFDYISKYPGLQSVTLFCKFLAREVCFYQFSSFADMQLLWEENACKLPCVGLSSTSWFAKRAKAAMQREYAKYCYNITRYLDNDSVSIMHFAKASDWLLKI